MLDCVAWSFRTEPGTPADVARHHPLLLRSLANPIDAGLPLRSRSLEGLRVPLRKLLLPPPLLRSAAHAPQLARRRAAF